MKIARLLLVPALLVAVGVPLARGDDASHAAAVAKLFQTMHMKEVTDATITPMVDMQVNANPSIKPFRQVMLDFMKKYISWESLQPDMTKLYMATFTEEEVLAMEKFYATPAGQKAAKAVPELAAKGAEIGQRRVQEHMAELQAAIAAEQERLGR
jgi:hypothetical protein